MPEPDIQLRINEIFNSLQGESKTIGLPTTFVRLTGCPLRCAYCDTEYAFHGGTKLTIDQIITTINQYKTRYICVTGGEPLAQPNCLQLLDKLCELDYKVSLETSGAMDIAAVNSTVSIVMDLKTPDSGEVNRNRYGNIPLLAAKDQLKFVICSRQDYEWAKFCIDQYKITEQHVEIFFSPSFGQLAASDLADWIVQDQLPVRFQLQLHKLLWNDEPGR